jgi:hypothetical protein
MLPFPSRRPRCGDHLAALWMPLFSCWTPPQGNCSRYSKLPECPVAPAGFPATD